MSQPGLPSVPDSAHHSYYRFELYTQAGSPLEVQSGRVVHSLTTTAYNLTINFILSGSGGKEFDFTMTVSENIQQREREKEKRGC